MTERERFLSRLAVARENGLVDVKFFFQPSKPVEPEEIFASLNQIEDAIEAGKCVKHKEWDGNHACAITHRPAN